jgi:heme-degrading monooxygenase HmoA
MAVINRLPVKVGAAGEVIERFANSRGNVQGFLGFVSMEVLSSKRGRGAGDHALARQRRLRLVGP